MTTSMLNFINQYSEAQKELSAEKAQAFERFKENWANGEPSAIETLKSELRAAMMHFEQTLARRYAENHRPTFAGVAA